MRLRRKRSRESELEARVEQLAQWADDLQRHAAEATAALAAQQRAMDGLEARISNLKLAEQVWSVMAYVRDAIVDQKALVSVILATRNRSQYLPRAIDSVVAQTYPAWELLIVDDGSEDQTDEVVRAVDDERIRCFRTPHRGLSAARNHALAKVLGDYVVYLDDDNTMHPDWLRSVVWAFRRWPEVDALYGATIIEAPVDAQESALHGMPWLRFEPYDRERLERENPTDIGAVAHRAGLREAVFDEELNVCGDWDLLLRITRTRDPLALPVVAGTYSTTAPNRLSMSDDHDRGARELRRKHDLPGLTPDGTEEAP